MANTTPMPLFAKSVSPPPPIVLLCDSDFILEPLPTLLAYEDLPLKHTTHSVSNHANARFERNASSSPRAMPMDNASPSHLSSALPTPMTTPAPEPRTITVHVSKIRKPRPKGAGRHNLTDIVELETGLLEKIKVCFASVIETPVC